MSLQITIMQECIVYNRAPVQSRNETLPRSIAALSVKMLLSTLSLAIFATLTSAQDFCTTNNATPGYCQLLSFTDRTLNTTSPPSSSDCQEACRGVLGEAGDWSVDFTGISPISHPLQSKSNNPRQTPRLHPEHGRLAVRI